MAEDENRAGRPARQAPSIREWPVPLGYRTSMCRECSALVTFMRPGKGRRVRMLSAEQIRVTRDGVWMAPEHRCLEGVGPRG